MEFRIWIRSISWRNWRRNWKWRRRRGRRSFSWRRIWYGRRRRIRRRDWRRRIDWRSSWIWTWIFNYNMWSYYSLCRLWIHRSISHCWRRLRVLRMGTLEYMRTTWCNCPNLRFLLLLRKPLWNYRKYSLFRRYPNYRFLAYFLDSKKEL